MELVQGKAEDLLLPPWHTLREESYWGCLWGCVEEVGVSQALTGDDQGPWSSRPLTLLRCRARSWQCCLPSLTQEEGRKEEYSTSLALSPKSQTVLLVFHFHSSCQSRSRWETGQKSRVREKHGSGARHTYRPSKTAVPTTSLQCHFQGAE